MANRHNRTTDYLLATLATLLIMPGIVAAQPTEIKGSIGGITFDPPRRARLRLSGRRYKRGEVIAVSPVYVRFRLERGKLVQYDFKDVRSLITSDGDVKYTSAHDSYKDIVNEAEGLAGVTIGARTAAAASGLPIELPRPPAPQTPIVVDSPDHYERRSPVAARTHHPVGQPAAIPPIPPAVAPVAQVAQGGTIEPFYETGAFKVGFLVACLAVVGLWWRNKVG